jgi:hypothetical protein
VNYDGGGVFAVGAEEPAGRAGDGPEVGQEPLVRIQRPDHGDGRVGYETVEARVAPVFDAGAQFEEAAIDLCEPDRPTGLPVDDKAMAPLWRVACGVGHDRSVDGTLGPWEPEPDA